jgi:hypothetical protein
MQKKSNDPDNRPTIYIYLANITEHVKNTNKKAVHTVSYTVLFIITK